MIVIATMMMETTDVLNIMLMMRHFSGRNAKRIDVNVTIDDNVCTTTYVGILDAEDVAECCHRLSNVGRWNIMHTLMHSGFFFSYIQSQFDTGNRLPKKKLV